MLAWRITTGLANLIQSTADATIAATGPMTGHTWSADRPLVPRANSPATSPTRVMVMTILIIRRDTLWFVRPHPQLANHSTITIPVPPLARSIRYTFAREVPVLIATVLDRSLFQVHHPLALVQA